MKIIKKINTSIYFDLFGVFLILLCAYLGNYFSFHLDSKQSVALFARRGHLFALLPFGLISTASSILSLAATRLTERDNRWGYIISIYNVLIAGVIDYALGNKGALLTYFVTYLISLYAFRSWLAHTPSQRVDRKMLILVVFIIAESFGVNYICYASFGEPFSALMFLSSFACALSTLANLFSILKLPEQWWFWFIYNIIQLLKSVVQGNFANLGKYIYYIINSVSKTPIKQKQG